jgi:hypothetical protein
LLKTVGNTTDQLAHCDLTLQANVTHVFRLELGLAVGWSVVGVEWLARIVWSHFKETNFPLDRLPSLELQRCMALGIVRIWF